MTPRWPAHLEMPSGFTGWAAQIEQQVLLLVRLRKMWGCFVWLWFNTKDQQAEQEFVFMLAHIGPFSMQTSSNIWTFLFTQGPSQKRLSTKSLIVSSDWFKKGKEDKWWCQSCQSLLHSCRLTWQWKGPVLCSDKDLVDICLTAWLLSWASWTSCAGCLHVWLNTSKVTFHRWKHAGHHREAKGCRRKCEFS